MSKAVVAITTTCAFLFGGLYGLLLVNIPIGFVLSAFYEARAKRLTPRTDERRELENLSECWLASAIPLCGPPLGVYMYCLCGMG